MELARAFVATSTFAGILLGATAAHAQSDGLRLAWSAPAGCPSADDVKASALRSVGGARIDTPMLADATVDQLGPSSWRVKLKMRRGETAGEREIEGPTCAGVADATAVVLALALVPPTTTMEEAPPAMIEAPPPAPPSAVPEARDRRLAAGVSLVGAVGLLPKVALGPSVHVAWTTGRVRVEAEGHLFPASQVERLPDGTAGAMFDARSVGARGCFKVVDLAAFDLAPCVGLSADIVSAEGRGADTNEKVTEVWLTFGGGVLGRVFLTRWLALRARVEANVLLMPPEFVIEGQGRVFRPPTIGASGFFGVEVLFL